MKVRILHRKRAVFAVLFTLLLSVAGVTKATAQSFTVGDLTYSFNDDGASVTLTGHVDGISGQLVIPESVELYGTSYSVTRIGDDAFQYCYDLTGDLVIPNSVITIGQDAFRYCHNMTGSLIIGNSVQNIRPFAFVGCNFTGTLTIPESVTEICWNVFDGCDFTTLNFNASNCYLYGGWLNGTSFTTLNLGANLTSIPDGLTSGCTTFTGSLTIPSSVTRIGDDAFNGCSGFTGALVIPEAVTYIGSSAFNGCSGFTGSLTISNAVTSIGNEAFNGCSGFTGSLTIPYTVTNIGNSAFMNCSGFSGTLTLGQSLAEIGNSAFFGACESFASFNVLAETPPTLGTNAFLSVNMEIPVSVPCGTLQAYQNTEGWSSFINFQEPDPCIWEILAMANPAIGGTVNGAGVYEQGQTCTLTATPVGDFVFSRWTENGIEVSTDAVYSFTVEGNRNLVARFTNPNFIVFADPNVENRCVELWDTDGDGYLSYNEAAAVTNLGNAFEYWGITSFDELQYFTGLTFLNSYEFYDCESLTSITLPDNITYFDYAAFANCYSLSSINVLATTPPGLNDNWTIFYNVDKSIPVTVPCGTTNSYQNTYGWNEFTNYQESNDCIYEITATVNIEEAGTVSGAGSFQKGSTCTLVAIPNEGRTFVRWMENGQEASTEATYSFTVTGPRNLVAVFMALEEDIIVFADENVKAVCVNNWDTDDDGELTYDEAAAVMDISYAFNYNQDITSFDELQYFTGLTSIGYCAFNECSNLTSIIIPEGVSVIGSCAFYDCYSLISINMPEGIVSIGEYAFYVCGISGELTLPESLEYVGEYAFYGCDGITTVNYNAINCQTMGSAAKPVFYDCAFTHLNIGENVQNIPNFAFKRCFMITDMTVAAVNPPTIYAGTFGMVSRSIPVYVPHGSGDAYRSDQYWEEFFNIIEVYFNDVQIVPLSQGTNWFSTNLDITLDDLKAALVAASPGTTITIKSQNSGQTTWNGRLWVGTLRTMDVSQMYMISVANACEITLEGLPIDPAEHPVTINNGPNWIGFPLGATMTITNAFANFASPGDIVKSDGGGQATWNGRIWTGQLKNLEPGKGYIYQSAAAGSRTFTFPTGAK